MELEFVLRWAASRHPVSQEQLVTIVNDMLKDAGEEPVSPGEVKQHIPHIPQLSHLVGPSRPKTVLVIPDTHEPFSMRDSIDFCKRIADEYSVDEVVHIGDLVDLHTASRWPNDPDALSAKDESYQARERVSMWVDAFPSVKMCIGNHDIRAHRQATKSGLSPDWVKGFSEFYQLPWDIQPSFLIDGVLYRHGTDAGGGVNPAAKIAMEEGVNVVQGHYHTKQGWRKNNGGTWGLQVGCLIDSSSYAFKYANSRGFKFGVAIVERGQLPIVKEYEV